MAIPLMLGNYVQLSNQFIPTSNFGLIYWEHGAIQPHFVDSYTFNMCSITASRKTFQLESIYERHRFPGDSFLLRQNNRLPLENDYIPNIAVNSGHNLVYSLLVVFREDVLQGLDYIKIISRELCSLTSSNGNFRKNFLPDIFQ